MNYNRLFDLATKKGIQDLELYIKKSKTLSLNVFHKNVEKYSISENEVISARGIVNGKMGVAYTEDLNALEFLLDKVIENANLIEEKKEVEIYPGDKKYKKNHVQFDGFSKVSMAEKIQLCLDGERFALEYDPRIVEVDESEYEEVLTEVKIFNSKGLKVKNTKIYGMYVLDVVAKEQEDIKTSYSYKLASSFAEIDVKKVAQNACQKAIEQLHGKPCASKKYKTLLTGDVMASLIGIFLSSVNGDSVNKGKSMLKDSLHQFVASSKVTIVEDPHCKDYPYFFTGFDDEGVATYKKKIVDKGVLTTFLYNLEAAKQAHCHSTGNGFKSGALSPVGIFPSFVYLKPGKKSKEELVKKIKNGIMICNVQGLHSGMDPISGNFSLQASGFLINDGKIFEPVNLITVAGNLFDLFKNIKEVGNDSFLSYSGILSPSVVVSSLTIAGK